MRELIERGHIFIAQPPLYKVKRGNSEQYLKDERAREDYLIESGLEGAVLRLADGEERAGQDLRAVVEEARVIRQVLCRSSFALRPRHRRAGGDRRRPAAHSRRRRSRRHRSCAGDRRAARSLRRRIGARLVRQGRRRCLCPYARIARRAPGLDARCGAASFRRGAPAQRACAGAARCLWPAGEIRPPQRGKASRRSRAIGRSHHGGGAEGHFAHPAL